MELNLPSASFHHTDAMPVEASLPIANPQAEQDVARLRQAAVKFEAFFVAQMMEQMRKATAALADKDSALNDQVNQAPLAMADNAVADALSAQGAFGIADVLVRQMAGGLPQGAAPSTSTTLRNMS
jgi:peptidoglycan hydrolase FlgJ